VIETHLCQFLIYLPSLEELFLHLTGRSLREVLTCLGRPRAAQTAPAVS
jgi:hypothetical protein